MRRRDFLTRSSLLAAIAGSPACALIFDGSKRPDERDYDRILWGWLILDILFTGLLGVIIDFATGAIYARKGGSNAGGKVAEIELCTEAAVSVVSFRRAGKAARYLVAHVPECEHCSHALANIPEPDVEVVDICRGDGEFLPEPYPVQLA